MLWGGQRQRGVETGPGGGVKVETEAEPLRETRNVPTPRRSESPHSARWEQEGLFSKTEGNSLRASFSCLRVLDTSGEMT